MNSRLDCSGVPSSMRPPICSVFRLVLPTSLRLLGFRWVEIRGHSQVEEVFNSIDNRIILRFLATHSGPTPVAYLVAFGNFILLM